jgi:hypothetical protein
MKVNWLSIGFEGELVFLMQYRKNWYRMFDESVAKPYPTLDKKYMTTENFEMFCHLNYSGLDAEAMFVEKVQKMK